MLLGTCLGLAVHLMVTCGVTNRPLLHVSEGWLQIGWEMCGWVAPFPDCVHTNTD